MESSIRGIVRHGWKPVCAAALVLALAAGCRPRSAEFRLSGTITIASRLHRKVPQKNAVLFIVVKNKGGVPLALQRIVNPQFPVSFSLHEEDLIVPGSRHQDAMVLQVQMNTHGRVGAARPGDLEGHAKDPVFSGEKRVHIVIDREI